MHLAQPTFPWLPLYLSPPQTHNRFAELRARLADQTPADARAANSLLLTAFTDILASLIDEQLTAGILRAAWGNLATAPSAKEPDHD